MTRSLHPRPPSTAALRAGVAALRLEALDDATPPRERRAAVAELARTAALASAALQEALAAGPDMALAATDALAGLAAGLQPCADAVDLRTRRPSVFRLLATHRQRGSLAQPVEELLLAPSDPVESMLSPATADQFALAAWSTAAGGLPLSFIAEQACRIDCVGATSYFLPTAEVERFETHNAVAGVVVGHRPRPEDAWVPMYYVLTQPVDRGERVVISIVSTTGRQVLAGVAEVAAGRAPFVLRSVLGPGALPIEVEGSYERGTVRLDRICADARRTAALAPEPAERPQPQIKASYP
jgi:hypothetical protein